MTPSPPGFLWGASTSAYQIEGGNDRSAFAAWERRRGWEPCGRAANSWELWREDVACLKRLGLNAYRFSVEWSRVEPHPGEFDDEALGRYAELARTLRREGIEPIACLHHFSEPEWLFRRAPEGWRSRAAVDAFLRFADRTVLALRGEVRRWLTFNEPMVWLLWGYAFGHFPPGLRRLLVLDRLFERELLPNVLAAHNEAYRLIHRDVPGASVSLAQNVADVEPAAPDTAGLEAAQRWDLFMHRRLLDLAAAAGTLDFIGVNYYTRILVSPLRLPFVPLRVLPGYGEVEAAMGAGLFSWLGGRRGEFPRTGMGWEICPAGLGRVLRRLWSAYGLPLIVTENGLDDAEGRFREAFLRDHLAAVAGARADGARVDGYLHWSLVDNYEWGSFKPRFGLFRVDRERGFRRTPAPGAELYAQLAAAGGA